MPIIPLGDDPPSSTSTGKIIPLDMEQTPVEEEGWKDRIYANAKAAYAGVMTFGSSLVKGAEKLEKGLLYATGRSKIPGFGGSTGLFTGRGEEAQKAYESAEADYQKNVSKYPETRVSKFLGEMGTQAPLLSGSLLMKGTELGGQLAGTAGKVLGSMAAGGASGVLSGGLRNEPGRASDDTWNEKDTATMGILGAALGPIGGMVIPQWTANATKYLGAKEGLRNVGYEGPVLSRDTAPDGLVKSLKNKLMDNLPLMTNTVRANQLAGVGDAVKKLVTRISERTDGNSEAKIGSIINSVRNGMDAESNKLWTGTFQGMKDAGLKHIPLSEDTKTLATKIATDYPGEISKHDLQTFLHPIKSYKAIAPEQLHKLKRDVVILYTKADKKATTPQEDLSDDLRDLYWKIDGSIGTALKDVPGLEQQYIQAKSYTKNLLSIFDPKKDKALAGAINEVNAKAEHLSTFVNSVLKPKSEKTTGYYDKLFGPSYSQEVEKLAVTKAFDKATDYSTGDLKLGSFFRQVEEAGGRNIIKNDTLQALQGLEKFTHTVNQARIASGTPAGRAIQSGAMMGTGIATASAMGVGDPLMAGGTAAGIAASAAALGWISKNSPAKWALGQLSRVWGKNDQITQRLVESISKQLPKAGITISQEGEDTRIHKEGKK